MCTSVATLFLLVCAAPGKPMRVERLLANLGYGKRRDCQVCHHSTGIYSLECAAHADTTDYILRGTCSVHAGLLKPWGWTTACGSAYSKEPRR